MTRVTPTHVTHPAMGYQALAVDGDGTVIRGGKLAKATEKALCAWRDGGRKLILVTGEPSKDLAQFPGLELFDLVIAENGAVLLDPSSGKARLLAVPPAASFVRAFRKAKIEPLKRGRVMLSTKESHEPEVVQLLRNLNAGWNCVRNRHQLMILPEGISKASGLQVALKVLGLNARQTIGVGDAENDIPLVEACGLGVAVANAVPSLKRHASLVTARGVGRGVVEVIARFSAARRRAG